MTKPRDLELVLSERNLIHASALWSLLVSQQSGIGVTVKSLDGRYRLANAAIGALFGRSSAEICGRSDRDFFSADAAERLQRSDERIKCGAMATRDEVELLVGGCRTRWLVLKFPLLAPAGAIQSIGALMLELSGRELIAEMRRTLDMLQQANLELQTSLVELDHLASTDRLTGAWNRRRLEEAIASEMDRLKRYDHPLCLLMLDVDHFKSVNDRYGHAIGDRLLVELVTQIRLVLRATDSVTRWGGEEFLILCPDTTLETAAVFAERLRRSVARMRFSIAEPVTVSLGVAECLPRESWEQWFQRGDAALLRAKAAGRNRVEAAPETSARSRIEPAESTHLVRLVWHRAYESGHALLDREHKALFRDANELFAAMLSRRSAHETSALVATLMRHVAEHFRDEETVIAAAGFPGVAAHAAIHRKLIERAAVLSRRVHAGEAELGEMFQFLAQEVVARHLLGADREFHPYLENRGRAARRSPALAQAR